MSNNLKLWNSVAKTDPDYTKKVNQRGGFTSVDSTYQARQATEQFGEYGRGWGLKDLNYGYVKGVKPTADGVFVEDILEIYLEATFWYCLEADDMNEFPISVDMQYRPNNDSRKKLLTEAQSKALSKLGFAADVFMGKFDDANYVKELKEEKEANKPKAKLSPKQLDAMIDAINRGNAEMVKKALPKYQITKVQQKNIDKAFEDHAKLAENDKVQQLAEKIDAPVK
jgi:hypothetical protein